jgi:hypothetical protein
MPPCYGPLVVNWEVNFVGAPAPQSASVDEDNVVNLKPNPATIAATITVELPTETAALINKFVGLNQHQEHPRPQVVGKARPNAAGRRGRRCEDGNSWQGARMALVLSGALKTSRRPERVVQDEPKGERRQIM